MQNIAEFRIIGRVSKITEHDKVTKVNVAANYDRQETGEWVTDTHWNDVTLFGKLIERATKAQKGDLIHITGRVRQNPYDTGEGRRYTVELIADYDQAPGSAALQAAVQTQCHPRHKFIALVMRFAKCRQLRHTMHVGAQCAVQCTALLLSR